jgi:serine/threonine protein kinase
MFALFECVAQAVMGKGVRGLVEFVPGGSYLFDVIGDAYKLLRERRKAAELRAEIEKVAAASAEEAKRAAEEAVRKVTAAAPAESPAAVSSEDRITLELYLSQIPGCVRQSMKRADDPSGKSVPADFALNGPEDLAKILPHRVPQFRPGADLPGRSGWRLDELLGAGGFGEVWLARHTFIPNRRGAVKFCTDPLARAKLVSHEGKVIARVMAQGEHPNVVGLLDAVLDGDAPWLMYEYVGGGNLTDLIHRWQALPAAERQAHVVAAIHQLASAVGAFHRLSPPIVHRDLKPSNILVSNPHAVLRITDFGIGGVAVEYMRTHHPRGLSLMSGWLETSLRGSYTPLYASPQQRAGSPPDPRDDVHALGVIGYQMATGRLDQAPGIDAAEDLREAGASDGLIALLSRCVAQKPERRPKDAGEFAEKLAELLGTAAPPRPAAAANPPPPLPPVARKEPPKAPPPPFVPTPMEGGAIPFPPAPAPKPAPAPPAVVRQSKWLIPARGLWFSRPTDNPESAWSSQPGKLPGEVAAKPGEAYRLALNPDEATDAALAKLKAVAELPGLEAIDLSGCGSVTDAGLPHLAALRGLKAVALADTRVTDAGLAVLFTRFPDLEAVSLAGAERVTQAVVPYLARLRKLKLLALPPRADTIDVRVELARRRPGCKVV